jgi:hypothetical protein
MISYLGGGKLGSVEVGERRRPACNIPQEDSGNSFYDDAPFEQRLHFFLSMGFLIHVSRLLGRSGLTISFGVFFLELGSSGG